MSLDKFIVSWANSDGKTFRRYDGVEDVKIEGGTCYFTIPIGAKVTHVHGDTIETFEKNHWHAIHGGMFTMHQVQEGE